MRDERYYQKLHQIREKYGYFNERNPQQNIRQGEYKRELHLTITHQQQANPYSQNYDFKQKPNCKDGWTDNHASGRYQKENFPVAPLSVIKGHYPSERNYRQKQPQPLEDVQRYNIDRPRSQRPSVSECSQYADFSQMQYSANNENSSPIRKLQCELSNPNTPRQYTNYNDRPSTMTPLRMNKNSQRPPVANATEKSPISRGYMPEQQLYDPTKRYQDRSSFTPDRIERANIARKQQQMGMKHYSQKGQQGGKGNFSLNSIDKIQEKIQFALNKNKK